ncbi:MAG: iron-containing alcohol dehydrogenase [Deltaproteobacteria bacterium]|nr:iron-containing alcohol dehydrogenase [Deltaproteobacteria bacterium]
MIPNFFQFHLPTKILFQAGLAKDFSNELAQLGVNKILFLTDSYWAKQPVTQEIIEGLKTAGIEAVEVFSDIPPNSELKVVHQATELGKKIEADGIIALGGGSVMDTAKAANILLSLGGDLVNDYSGTQTITSDLKPLIVIPTTSGTGSEVTKVAVIYDAEHEVKLAFVDTHLYPTLAILDPELTLTMPPQLTAMTGMDALTHAIESYTSQEQNSFSHALAKHAIQLVVENLPLATKEGSNLEARSALLVASNLAGVAFDHAMVGIVHSMSHSVGAVSHVPHGLANSILLPYGMEYNFELCESQYADLAFSLGALEQSGKAALKSVYALRAQLKEICGLPDSLKEAGVKEEDLPRVAQLAVEDGSSFYNPKEVVETEVLETLKKAY